MTNKNQYDWLATLYLSTACQGKIVRCLDRLGSMDAIFQAKQNELASLGFSENEIKTIKHPNHAAIEKDLLWARESHHHFLFYDDHAYPAILREITDPPLVLYIKGDKHLLSQVQIAIVGARHATSYGLNIAEQFAHDLAKQGLVITSGFALGIDGAAHRGALKAKGRTIGVSGTGFNYTYPTSHRCLIDDIISEGGAIISEFHLATPGRAANFPKRNRIISGLSLGVLIVEAALKSGSLITARCAMEQGRDVFAVPGSIHQPLARGCHYLIQQGAKLVQSIEDILEEYPHQSNKKFESVTALDVQVEDDMIAEHRQLFDQITHETTSIDMIILRTGLTMSEVSSILLTLELRGYIQSVPGGYIRVTKLTG